MGPILCMPSSPLLWHPVSSLKKSKFLYLVLGCSAAVGIRSPHQTGFRPTSVNPILGPTPNSELPQKKTHGLRKDHHRSIAPNLLHYAPLTQIRPLLDKNCNKPSCCPQIWQGGLHIWFPRGYATFVSNFCFGVFSSPAQNRF